MKTLLIFTITISLIRLLACQPVSAPMGPCECGVFNRQHVEAVDQPIIKNQPLNVTCEESGHETCAKMCKALAEAAKPRGPTLLCSSILHATDLKVSIFTRICDKENWIYTGITSDDIICCHNGEPVPCAKVH